MNVNEMDKKQKFPRARANDTIEDLHADDMLTSGKPWTKPRHQKKKESTSVSSVQGRKMLKEVVQRYSFLEKNSSLVKDRRISEQDISTKFILPMLSALNWDSLRITSEGAEVHEKGFRERDIEGSVWEKVRHGLPDFSLKGEYSSVPFFVEVKHPAKGRLNPDRDLKVYRDGHLILLTSFEESRLVVVGKNDKKYVYDRFTAVSPELYLREFNNLWRHVSNTKKADATRRAIKATRPGFR